MTDYPEIKFDDIHKGDRIRNIYKTKGVLATREGVARHVNRSGNWLTAAGGLLALRSGQGKIYLLDRPKKELPTTPGSVLLEATLDDGRTLGPLMLDQDGDWVGASVDGGWLTPDEITSFTPGKIVEADQ